MKHRAFMLLLFLIAGAIINVAVAWGCAGWLSNDGTYGWLTCVEIEPGVWSTTFDQSRFGHTRLNCVRGPVPFDHQRGRLAPAKKQSGPANEFLSQKTLAGWPLRALECERHGAVDIRASDRFGYIVQHPTRDQRARGGIELSSTSTMLWRPLPYRPIMPGFAINTIFYAAIVWLLFAVPGAVRRRVRRKRGQCATCGYSVRECLSEKCPECGTMI
jgi:hypothetical protein